MFEDALRIPRLDTVLMVEKHVEDNSGKYRKKELWENLPKKMMYQTYCVALEYLEGSHKVKVDETGKIHFEDYKSKISKFKRRLHTGKHTTNYIG